MENGGGKRAKIQQIMILRKFLTRKSSKDHQAKEEKRENLSPGNRKQIIIEMLMCDDNMNIAIYKLRYPSRGAR
jgi:hypothetical protein